MKQAGWRLVVKKSIDRAVAAAALVVTAPIMAGAAVAVRASMGSPVLFRQTRPGRYGEPLGFLKFRTMREANGPDGRPLPDAERMTGVGRFLRNTSIDELPQLVNVLRGELSLVGPRPLLMSYLSRYTPDEMRRHDVMPGITGLAAISGRNHLSWEDRFRFDLEYVDNWSLALDAKILLLTAFKVLTREGASGDVVTTELRPASERFPTNGAGHTNGHAKVSLA